MKCLNCSIEFQGDFCSNCGQSAKIKRFTFNLANFYEMILHALQANHGFLFTLKSIVLRPGVTIQEYIAGKRKRYFNWVSFLLIVVTLSYFVESLSSVSQIDLLDEKPNDMVNRFFEFKEGFPRLFAILILPIHAITSFIFFRKASLNFLEHLILNSFKVSLEMLVTLLFFTTVTLFYTNIEVLRNLQNFISVITALVGIWVYYQFFSTYYTKKIRLLIRSLFSYIVFFIIIMFIVICILAYAKLST